MVYCVDYQTITLPLEQSKSLKQALSQISKMISKPMSNLKLFFIAEDGCETEI
jgi:hypothetical protein